MASALLSTICLYFQRTYKVSQKCAFPAAHIVPCYSLTILPLVALSLALLSAVYYRCSESEGHKRVHLPA